jgi:hypothetical protein
MLQISLDGNEAESKRRRQLFWPHQSLPQSTPQHHDRLNLLYPNQRDDCCHKDDKSHRYVIGGETYPLSVSTLIQRFFNHFDAREVSTKIINRYDITPLFGAQSTFENRNEIPDNVLRSSIYNVAQYMRLSEKVNETYFLEKMYDLCRVAEVLYESKFDTIPFSTNRILEMARQCWNRFSKPKGPSCYYFFYLYTKDAGKAKQAESLMQTWHINGQIESLKGTFLHKKIELYINALVLPMESTSTRKLPLRQLLQQQVPGNEFSAETVMTHVAWATDPNTWDHPTFQCFLREETQRESIEFKQFLQWLVSKPTWSPYRIEWSIYSEDFHIAGQIDSLWIDTDSPDKLIMVDWKRKRELLTDDVDTLRHRAFQKRGLSCCEHLYDTAWNHYLAQQSLYAFVLRKNYAKRVSEAMLVQCHRELYKDSCNEKTIEIDFNLAEAMISTLERNVENDASE